MNADFFREDKRRRVYNPTFASSHLISTMVYPERTIEVHPHQKNIYSPIWSPTVHPNPQKQQRKPQLNLHQKKKSSLSNYGSSSLKHLRHLSGQDVQKIQKKNFNIISLEGAGLEKQLRKEELKKISGKVTQVPQKIEDDGMYMGISTVDRNIKEQAKEKFKNRPFYLNNADEIQF